MKTRMTSLTNALEKQAVAGGFWKSLANKPALTIDDLVKKYTAASNLNELCELGKGTSYRPSIYVRGNAEKKRLADAYDARQVELDDPRKAFRGW
jgi:hypothetical protein